MNRLYTTTNSGGTHAWIVAEDEDDARVVAKESGHVRKPENLNIGDDITEKRLADETCTGLREILESGYRGQVAILSHSVNFADMLIRIKHNVIVEDNRPKPAWIKSGKEAK